MTDAGPSDGGPEDPLLRKVAEYWDEIQRLADEDQRERLRGLVEGTAEPDPVEALAALADELLDLLPPDHPVALVLSRRVMFAGGSPEISDAELANDLLRLQGLVLGGAGSRWPASAEPPVLEGFHQQVTARLLGLPSLSPEEVRRNGEDPNDRRLIRLTRPDGTVQLPAFQFTAAGRPWPVVQEVNMRLDAGDDPWGVACWWVDPHARLRAVPADLLGRDEDDLLLRAAAVVGEDY